MLTCLSFQQMLLLGRAGLQVVPGQALETQFSLTVLCTESNRAVPLEV